MERSFTITIDFTDEFFAADIPTNVWPDFEDSLAQIGAVSGVCIDHCCWVEADVGNPQLQSIIEIAEEIERGVRKAIDYWKDQ